MKLVNQNINLNYYKIFYMVAKLKSFSRASEELHVSQPSISYSIKKLEKELNVQLFYRDKKKITLTNEGTNVLKYVKKALYTFNIIEENALNTNGSLSIGAPAHITISYIFDYLKKFLNTYSNINLILETGNIDKLIDKMENYELDFIIDTFPKNCKYNNIKSIKIAKFKKGFIYNREKMSFLNNKKLEIEDLKNYTLILPLKNNNYRKELDLILYKNNIKPKNIIEVTNTSLMYKFVDEGFGIGYLIEELIEKNDKYGIVDFNYELPTCELDIIYIEKYNSLIAKKFIKYILERNNIDEKVE